MKSSKTFVFDIDGVLADFILGFTKLGHAKFGGIAYSTLQQKTWGQFAGLSKEQERLVWEDVLTSPDFWESLHPLASYSDWIRINFLCKNANVYFATNRAGVEPMRQTKNWLYEHDIDNPNVIITKYKGECCRVVDAMYAIDDKADNASCIAWTSQRIGGITIPYLLDRPYNQYDDLIIGSKHVKRIHTLNQYIDDCLEACE